MYALYFPEDGRYTKLMPLAKAKALSKHFTTAYIVDHNGIEI